MHYPSVRRGHRADSRPPSVAPHVLQMIAAPMQLPSHDDDNVVVVDREPLDVKDRTQVAHDILSVVQAEVAAFNAERGVQAHGGLITFDDVAWSAAVGIEGVGGCNNITDVGVSDDENTPIVQINTGQVRPITVKANTHQIIVNLYNHETQQVEKVPLHTLLQYPRKFSMPGCPPANVDSLLADPRNPSKPEDVQINFKVVYIGCSPGETSVNFSPSYFSYGTNNQMNGQNILCSGRRNDPYLAMEVTKPGWARLFKRDDAGDRCFIASEDTGVRAQKTSDVTGASFSDEEKAKLEEMDFKNGDDLFMTLQIPNLQDPTIGPDPTTKCVHFHPVATLDEYMLDDEDVYCSLSAYPGGEDAPVYRSGGDEDDSPSYRGCYPMPTCNTNIVKLGNGTKVEPLGQELVNPDLYKKPLAGVRGRGPGEIKIIVQKVVVCSGRPSKDDVRSQLEWLYDQSALHDTFVDADWQKKWEAFEIAFTKAYPETATKPTYFAAQDVEGKVPFSFIMG